MGVAPELPELDNENAVQRALRLSVERDLNALLGVWDERIS